MPMSSIKLVCPTCGHSRRKQLSVQETTGPSLTRPQDVVTEHLAAFAYAEQEHFIILLLNTRHKVISSQVVTIGILNASLVHAREVFRAAIRENAHAIIIAHNHPSGDPTPSEDDLKITEELTAAGKLLGIQVLDHFIVAGAKWLSMREENLL